MRYNGDMEDTLARKRGRPEGKEYEHSTSFRFGLSDLELLDRVAKKMRISKAAVLRRGIVKLAREEGVEA